jgi:hypothetical protein
MLLGKADFSNFKGKLIVDELLTKFFNGLVLLDII